MMGDPDLSALPSFHLSYGEADTLAIGYTLGALLPQNTIVCLYGDLGAGKTTLVRGLVSACCPNSEAQVSSPTFVYLHQYAGEKRSVYHFDLYRMQKAGDFLDMGFDETFYAGGICCIEWADRICSLLPKDVLNITISHLEENSRQIVITRDGNAAF